MSQSKRWTRTPRHVRMHDKAKFEAVCIKKNLQRYNPPRIATIEYKGVSYTGLSFDGFTWTSRVRNGEVQFVSIRESKCDIVRFEDEFFQEVDMSPEEQSAYMTRYLTPVSLEDQIADEQSLIAEFLEEQLNDPI